MRVVGVVEDEHQQAVADPAVPEVEIAIPQITPESGFYQPTEGVAMDLALRTSRPAAEIVPVASVDDREVGSGKPGPITQAIQQVFFETVRGQRDEYSDWLDYVG